jgi:hypothetical protein
MMRPVLLAALLFPSLAWAEPMPGCREGEEVHTIVGFHGPNKSWVEFFSAAPEAGMRNDYWVLRHCRTGWQVHVMGFTPFDFPSDDPSEAPPATWVESEDARVAIDGVMDQDFPRGGPRRVAETIAVRLLDAGWEGTPTKGPLGSCVCDPGWN